MKKLVALLLTLALMLGVAGAMAIPAAQEGGNGWVYDDDTDIVYHFTR